jgi:hypothetical protein
VASSAKTHAATAEHAENIYPAISAAAALNVVIR